MLLRKIIVIFSLVFLFQIDIIFCQNIAIETTIDSNRIVIGDQIGLKYNFVKENWVQVELPLLSANIIEGIEIIGIPLIDSVSEGNKTNKISLKYTITSFDTGMYFIPPLPFVVHKQYGIDTLYSKASYLEVVGVAIDTTGTVRDIKAIASAPLTLSELLPYILGLLILALAVFLLVKYYRKRKAKISTLIPVKPTEPVHITALKELDKIKAQKLWQQKQVKEYYVRITHVIRWYISKRYNIPALEETSDEILDHLAFLKLNQKNYEELEGLLNLADLVKFAKGEPNPDDNIIHLDNAYDFVKRTKESLNETEPEVQENENNSL
jgi:large-conductance mechanosensitive channel